MDAPSFENSTSFKSFKGKGSRFAYTIVGIDQKKSAFSVENRHPVQVNAGYFGTIHSNCRFFRAMRLDMIQICCRPLCMTFTAVSDWGAFVGVLCLGKGMIGQMCVQMQGKSRSQV